MPCMLLTRKSISLSPLLLFRAVDDDTPGTRVDFA